MKKNNNRLVLIDILKILFALFVFMRHSATMGGCKYPIISTDYLVEVNNVMMSAFFIISGFSLYYVYSKKKMDNISECMKFYKKRALSILPIYFLLMVLHFVFLESDLKLNIKLLPLEITGTHSFFDGLFTFLHNGTTWFISCIILSYFLYPYLQQLINYFDKKKRYYILGILLLFLTYLGFAFNWFSFNPYTNPLFRCMEFAFGVVLCSVVDFSNRKINNKKYLFVFIILLILMFVIVYLDIKILGILSKYLLLGLMIYIASKYVTSDNKISRGIFTLSKMTYAFYILQDLIWNKNKVLNSKIRLIENNYLRIGVFFIILLAMAIIVTFVYQKYVIKYFLKKDAKR